MDQPGKVTNPGRGQLNKENNIPLSPCVPENLVSRDGFSRPVPRQPAHLHTQAESGAYLRNSSRVPRRRPFMKPPYAIGSVPSLSGHANAYRWCERLVRSRMESHPARSGASHCLIGEGVYPYLKRNEMCTVVVKLNEIRARWFVLNSS